MAGNAFRYPCNELMIMFVTAVHHYEFFFLQDSCSLMLKTYDGMKINWFVQISAPWAKIEFTYIPSCSRKDEAPSAK